MLAMAVVWVSAACVLGCEERSKERPAKEVAVSSADLEPVKTCEDCPFASFPKAARGQRLTPQPDAQVAVVIPNSTSPGLIIDDVSLFGLTLSKPTIDPPLKRLRYLRI
jgi:hypothetical protein